jgi:hypothetical protein
MQLKFCFFGVETCYYTCLTFGDKGIEGFTTSGIGATIIGFSNAEGVFAFFSCCCCL